MDVQPRQIMAYYRAGDLDSILRSRTLWICASCYACTVRCPAGIKVTDIIYGLKRMALDDKVEMHGLPIHELSQLFVKIVNRTGRNDEIELATRFFLHRAPWRLFKMMPLGIRLWRAGRLPLKPQRVKGIEGLRLIIAKAEEMEQLQPRETVESLGEIGYAAVTERVRVGVSSEERK